MRSGAYAAAPSGSEGGGAFWPRPRGRLSIGAVLVVAAVAIIGVVLLTSGGGVHRVATNDKYGTYPAWLPHTKLPPLNTAPRTTLSHPLLNAVEGNTVLAVLPGGAEADITAIGPTFPAWVSSSVQAGTLSDGTAVPSRFTVTVVARRGNVPLRGSAFSILTAAGQLVHPAVTGPGGKAMPASLRAGQHLNLTVSTKLVEGEGALRWAPSGSKVISAWLYQVELD